MSIVETVNQLFYQVVDRQLDRAMLYKQTVKWIPISSRELYRDAVGIARALSSARTAPSGPPLNSERCSSAAPSSPFTRR
jgi:hypothetical protein